VKWSGRQKRLLTKRRIDTSARWVASRSTTGDNSITYADI
jgi:hypothetical protein